VTERSEETIQEGTCCSDAQCRTCLRVEVARLTHLNERLRGENDEWQKIIAALHNHMKDRDATIATLKKELEWAREALSTIVESEQDAQRVIAKLQDGSEYWGMNQELTEQIATLRATLNENTEIMLASAKLITTLRERLAKYEPTEEVTEG